jgi:hypothetical protein
MHSTFPEAHERADGRDVPAVELGHRVAADFRAARLDVPAELA